MDQPASPLPSHVELTEQQRIAADRGYVDALKSGALFRDEASRALALDHQHGIGVL